MEIKIDLFNKPSDYRECVLKDTEACKSMNNPGCSDCELGKSGEEAQMRALEDFELLKRLLPPEGITHMAKSEECLFCKGEEKGKRSCYAITDFGHKEPQRTKASVIGIKVKTRVGSMVPLQIACCRRCRRNFVMRDYLSWAVMAAFAIVLLILLSITSIRESLMAINELLPLGIFAGVFFVGYIVGNLLKSAFAKAKSRETQYNLYNIPTVGKMQEMGWFSLFGEKKELRLIFSKKRLERGWFAGDHVEA